jgi:cellulose synthase/poly-beta-1,6-N-acetylglucosamine synthase-like glycosyltransferase
MPTRSTCLKLVEQPERVYSDTHASHLNPTQKLGGILCRNKGITRDNLHTALALQRSEDTQLGHILLARGMVSDAQLLAALSDQFGAEVADFAIHGVETDLIRGLDPLTCLRFNFLPWRKKDDVTLIATSNPARFEQICATLPPDFGPVEMRVTTRGSLQSQIASIWQPDLTERAEQICPQAMSCRSWARPLARPVILTVFVLLIMLGITFPIFAIWIIYGWIMLNLFTMSALRVTALVQQFNSWRGSVPKKTKTPTSITRLPKVSILVPLYKEAEILPKLVDRLSRIDYPKELLEICLILEAGDQKTANAVQETTLPTWIRVITAPPARLRTKPRAMNYALDFCNGDIIGIYDAEDAPEADQITRIVQHFRRAGPEVACIQSYLDYYNPTQNWLARCFTIEYAIWFRLVLQGVERMRLPVPLGGTSVFFRRHVLEELGAWDAHNVTEDADLGMRLARFGYRCAFEATTTYEEANCHTIPWIKQRSRWLKGYAMTWITHMRNPRALWRDLGAKGFLTFNVILLGTLSSFLLAPAIWSFWLISLGFTPKFFDLLPEFSWQLLTVVFIGSEILHAILGVVATSGKGHRKLIAWVPTMVFYWPLGTIAAYKAIYELLLAPFYWDKTKHGISDDKTTGGS